MRRIPVRPRPEYEAKLFDPVYLVQHGSSVAEAALIARCSKTKVKAQLRAMRTHYTEMAKRLSAALEAAA